MRTKIRLLTFWPVFNRFLVHYSDVIALDGDHCAVCHEIAFEAWERQTFGGVGSRTQLDPTGPGYIEITMRVK